MPLVTKIVEQKRRANRRSVYLDGAFAFGCNVNVVARFRLREGMTLTPEQVEQIRHGEVRQECFDHATKLLGVRLQSRAELRRKLVRAEYGEAVVDAVIDDLARMGYVEDDRFAKTRALSAAQHKHHGKRRAMAELMKSGVTRETASRAVEDVYDKEDTLSIARQLVAKQTPRLRKLAPLVARRRLVGMLQRRGFDYDTIKPILDEVLGSDDAP
jgi:regulatory protein